MKSESSGIVTASTMPEARGAILLLTQRNNHSPRPLKVPRSRTCAGCGKKIGRLAVLEEDKGTLKIGLMRFCTVTPLNRTRICLDGIGKRPMHTANMP